MPFPNRPVALYRFWDVADRLLYVGITQDIDTRVREHERHSRWFRFVKWIAVDEYENRWQAERAEQAVIRDERPSHNILHVRRNRRNESRLAGIARQRERMKTGHLIPKQLGLWDG